MSIKENYSYPELNITMNKSLFQKEIYLASSFWKMASEKIKIELEEGGIENFRNLKTCLDFFVPNYGIPANSFDQKMTGEIHNLLEKKGSLKQKLAIESFLSGYLHALSDYRVFISSRGSDNNFNLIDFSESNFGNPVEQFDFKGKKYSRSSLNYLLGLCFLKDNIYKNDEIKTVMEIGGGFGTLGEILSFSKGVKYINVDIPPISFISWNYLKKVYKKNINPYLNKNDIIHISKLNQCSVFNSWDIEKIKGKLDLFVNFISFQEMEPDIVKNYIKNIVRLDTKWILLRNMKEGKRMKNSPEEFGVETPIKSSDYIKMLENNYKLIASDVIRFGYKTPDGFHSELLLFKKK